MVFVELPFKVHFLPYWELESELESTFTLAKPYGQVIDGDGTITVPCSIVGVIDKRDSLKSASS